MGETGAAAGDGGPRASPDEETHCPRFPGGAPRARVGGPGQLAPPTPTLCHVFSPLRRWSLPVACHPEWTPRMSDRPKIRQGSGCY